jgi:pyruvate formate lyase activating enzyme
LVKKFPRHEFRTTIIPTIHTKSDLLDIGKWLGGANKYVLQQFRPDKTLDPSCGNIEPYPEKELRNFCLMLKDYFSSCELRV